MSTDTKKIKFTITFPGIKRMPTLGMNPGKGPKVRMGMLKRKGLGKPKGWWVPK